MQENNRSDETLGKILPFFHVRPHNAPLSSLEESLCRKESEMLAALERLNTLKIRHQVRVFAPCVLSETRGGC